MSLYNLPLSAFGFCYLFCVVVTDLNFDFQSDSEITYNYYKGMKKASLPLSQMINLSILFAFIPLVINLIKYRRFLDILTVIVASPAFFIFVLILIPNQEKLVSLKESDDLSVFFQVNSFWHKVLLIQMFLSMIFQILARKDKTKHD